MEQPRVSAALIVRNEEKFLAGCLDSLAGFADEVVLVDTGSTDATPRIAADRRITVHTFAWADDFSAARNYGLDRARGEWILYIDADERIRAGAEAVRRRLLNPDYIGFQVLLTPHTGTTPYWALRLWRNRPAIRFRGVIHESPWPALLEYQAACGGKVGNTRLELDHRGYEGDTSHKNVRNLPLLERYLEQDPSRVFCWCQMADIRLAQGKTEAAEQCWRRALEIVRSRSHSQTDDFLPWLGLIHRRMNQNADVTELLEEALARFPHDLHFRWLQGRSLMGQERFQEAIPHFEHLARCGETGEYSRHASYDVRLLGVLAWESLATCHFRLGMWADAVRCYDRAIACEPARMDLRAKRALAAGKGSR